MPRYSAHCCPVCKGKTEITAELAQHEAQPKYKLPTGNIYNCHVCMGAGFMWHTHISDAEARGEPDPQDAPVVSPQIIPNQIGGLIPPSPMGGTPFNPPIVWTSHTFGAMAQKDLHTTNGSNQDILNAKHALFDGKVPIWSHEVNPSS